MPDIKEHIIRRFVQINPQLTKLSATLESTVRNFLQDNSTTEQIADAIQNFAERSWSIYDPRIENWRTVFGQYQVSDRGIVKYRKGILTSYLRDGYPFVDLYKKGKRKHCPIHNLVLTKFYGPRPEEMECRHLDGNKANNHLKNLEWGTHRENERDKRIHKCIQVRTLFDSGKYNKTQLSKKFHLNFWTVNKICDCKFWEGATLDKYFWITFYNTNKYDDFIYP